MFRAAVRNLTLSFWMWDDGTRGARETFLQGTITDGERDRAAPVAALATQLDVSPARVLLRYALQKGWAVLPKSTREERIKDNFDLDTFSLSDDQMRQLDGLEAGANFAWDAPPGQHSDLTTTP